MDAGFVLLQTFFTKASLLLFRKQPPLPFLILAFLEARCLLQTAALPFTPFKG